MLEVKVPTIWTDGKPPRWEESEKKVRRQSQRKEEKKKRSKKRKLEKVRKVTKHCVFSRMICGSKRRLSNAAGAEPAGQMRDGKLHAVVARSAFGSQKCQKTVRFGALLEVEMSRK